MAICCVVASESLLTYDSVRSGGIPRSALHLTIPEQAPSPNTQTHSLGVCLIAGPPMGVDWVALNFLLDKS